MLVALDQGDQWEDASEPWENAGFSVITLDNRRPNEIDATLAKTVIDGPGQRQVEGNVPRFTLGAN